MKMVVVMAVASIALAACSNSKDSKSGGAQAIPESLAPHALVNKPALTEAQKSQIRAFTAQTKNVPDAGLIVPANNESAQQKQERQEKRANLDPNAKRNLSWIEGACTVSNPQETSTGNLDGPGSTQVSTVVSSITGNNCPINYRSTDKNTSTMVNNNQAALDQ